MAVRVLVTGGSGFLGGAVVDALQVKHPDWILYNLDIRPSNRNDDTEVQFESANITVAEKVDAVFDKLRPHVVVHTAGVVPNGQARYSNSKNDRDWVFSINYDGTRNVLDAAKKSGCKTFVYTSSCTVMTDDVNHDYPLMDETIPIGHATLIYGSSKVHRSTSSELQVQSTDQFAGRSRDSSPINQQRGHANVRPQTCDDNRPR